MDETPPTPSDPRIIHLGMLRAEGPGTFVSGVFKLRGDPAKDLLESANDFTEAADRCLTAHRVEQGVSQLVVPGTVCAAFACELFLKYIVLRETGQHPRGHDLAELLGQLKELTRNSLSAQHPDVAEVLGRNADHFRDGRYHFELAQFSFRQAELLQTAKDLREFVAKTFPLP